MKTLLFALLGLVSLAALLGVIGSLLPATRNASAQREIAAPPAHVWSLLVAVDRQPSWRAELASVQVLDATPGRERWIEHPKQGPAIHFSTESQSAGTAWSLTFSGPAEGRWTGRLEHVSDNRTRILIEESATVANPWARLLAHLFFDPQAFVDTYLDQLSTAAESATAH
jgi:Polyketide cyclase / dehydrase and lipid transport